MTTSAAPGRATSDTPKTRRLGRLAAALAFLVVAMASSGLLSARAADTSNGLDVVGTMPLGFDLSPSTAIPAMFVDSAQHLGAEELSSPAYLLQMYDLARLKPTVRIPFPPGFQNQFLGSGITAALDERHHQMFWPPNATNNTSCLPTPLYVLDLLKASWTSKNVPCTNANVTGQSFSFDIDGISYHAPTNKLYVTGMSGADSLLDAGPTKSLSQQEPTIVRELDADTLDVGWELDISSFCDWHQVSGTGAYGGLLTRVGNHVVLYCHKGGGQGGFGEIVDIPLDGQGKPEASAIRSIVAVRTNDVRVDPVTGRLLLVASTAPYGPAVWIYDGPGQRFLGVVPTGVQGAFLAGLDESSGRLYLHDSKGFVVVDARHDPIPGGVRYDTLAAPLNDLAPNFPAMAVDRSTHRLIFADYPAPPPGVQTPPSPKQYRVVEDDIPSIVDVCAGKPKPCPDPDTGTEDIPEVPGQTGHTFSSGANAFGVHLLNTGGIPNDIQDLPGDTFGNGELGTFDCYIPSPAPCASTAAASPGDREGFLAQTSLAQGSALGSTGYATAGRVGPNDHATDADIREAGNCEADRLGSLFGNDALRNGVQTLCQNENMPQPLKDALASMRAGTERKDGSEYPINGSLCVDFGGTSGDKESHDPSPQMGYSKVHCDAKTPQTTTDAEFAVVGLPQVPNANTLAIAHSTSHAESELTDKGVVTEVDALAEGINIGGQLTIGRIATHAETRAHGRTGTSFTDVKRNISDVHGPGIDCVAACDAKKVADAINQAFAPRITATASDPARVASAKGFTGSVGKDPSLQAADSLITDDDSLTWDGLDLLVVNDQAFQKNKSVDQGGQTPSGNRSRLLIGLAGVQAESHYGIFKLPPPSSGGGGGTDAAPPAPGTPDIPATPGQDVFTPGTPASVQHDAGTLGFHLAGSVGKAPQHKKKPSLVSQLLHGIFHPLEGLKNFWALIINHPFEAVMVFLMLALLGTPVYLAMRRRQMMRVLMSEA